MINGENSASAHFTSWFGDVISRVEEALAVIVSYDKGWLMTIIVLKDMAAGLAFRSDGMFLAIASKIPSPGSFVLPSAVLSNADLSTVPGVLGLLTEAVQRVLDAAREQHEKQG